MLLSYNVYGATERGMQSCWPYADSPKDQDVWSSWLGAGSYVLKLIYIHTHTHTHTHTHVGYSESKYRLRISLAHPRDCHFAHVQWLPLSIEKDTDAISWNSCYVYVCSCAFNMFKTIEGAANCEIRSVIRFLNARNVLSSSCVDGGDTDGSVCSF